MTDSLGRIHPLRRTGFERFRASGVEQDFDLIDFWRWLGSDLGSNALRGTLAEYIVARALGASADLVRTEWDAYDVVAPDGVTVEVKSAAYIQSWEQSKPVRISFSIGPRRAWFAETNTYSADQKRHADIYVFALLHHRDATTLNPLDLDQWSFYVASTARINELWPTAKSVGLAKVEQAFGPAAGFMSLNEQVKRLLPVEAQRSYGQSTLSDRGAPTE